MALMTIGEFAERTRLSPKALRLYDELKLVVPARVDTNSGYRLYAEDQVEPARLVGLLRQADMPLALIASVVALEGADAARAVVGWWEQVEAGVAERRAVVSYLHAHLRGEDHAMFDIDVRSMPERRLVTISRHVHSHQTDGFFDQAFARLRTAGPGIPGIEGVPFLVFYGEVSDDSDGPIELCRPVAPDVDVQVEATGDIELRVEPAHDEAYIRLALRDLGWPAMRGACDALERWVAEHQRHPAGALRQLLIADQRTANPETLVCDLTVPVR